MPEKAKLVSERGVQPEADAADLDRKEDLDEGAGTEVGLEIEVDRPEHGRARVGVGGERAAELVERRHVGADHAAHRELHAGHLVKDEGSRADRVAFRVRGDGLRRPAGERFERLDREPALEGRDGCRVGGVDAGGRGRGDGSNTDRGAGQWTQLHVVLLSEWMRFLSSRRRKDLSLSTRYQHRENRASIPRECGPRHRR